LVEAYKFLKRELFFSPFPQQLPLPSDPCNTYYLRASTLCDTDVLHQSAYKQQFEESALFYAFFSFSFFAWIYGSLDVP